jgi:hypothetical protein
MWNVPAGLFNWLLPGTGLVPSPHLNFGTVGASGSSNRFKTQAILLCFHAKEKVRPTAGILFNFNSLVQQFRASSNTTVETKSCSENTRYSKKRTNQLFCYT